MLYECGIESLSFWETYKIYFYERTSLHLEGKGDKIGHLVFSLKLVCKTGTL
jgi:hypothetical protein